MKDFLHKYKDILFVIAVWILVGYFAPRIVAIVVSIGSFFLIIRTMDSGKILFALLTILLFSDSRSAVFAFAAQAKVGFIALTLLYCLAAWKRLPIAGNKVFRFFLPFLFYAFVLIPFSKDIFDTFQKTLSYTIVYLTVPLFFLDAAQKNKDFLRHFVVFIFLVLASGLIIRFVNPDFVTLAERYRGILGNPNGLGIYLTLSFPLGFIILHYLHKRDPSEQMLKWGFYIVLVSSLLLCQSRTAILACLLFLLFNSVDFLRGWFGFLFFMIIVFSYEYMLAQLPAVIIALNLGEFFRIETLMEGSGRVVAWDFAWKKVQDVFFFGGGFDYANDLFKANYSYLSRLGHQGNAHNSFLTLWLDTGLVGVVLFSIGLIRFALHAIKRSLYTLPVMYGVLFSTNFESWLAASLNPFTSLFLIILTLLSHPELLTAKETERLDPEPKNPGTLLGTR